MWNGFLWTLILASFSSGVLLSGANGQEAASEVIAAQIRTQGYQCDDPQRATHDRELSRPNQQVWVLRCTNATYRVKLTPRMAAQVERLD